MTTRVHPGQSVNGGARPVGEGHDDRGTRGRVGPTESQGEEHGHSHGLGRRDDSPNARAAELSTRTAPLVDKLKNSFGDGPDPRGNAYGQDHEHGLGPHDSLLNRAPDIIPDARERVSDALRESMGEALGRSLQKSSAVEYLRGNVPGAELPVELRGALDQVLGVLGRDAVNGLLDQHGNGYEKLFDKLLGQASRAFSELGPTAQERGHAVQQVVDELLSIAQLGKYFAQLERVGGEPVRRAEEAALRLLSSARGSGVEREYERLNAAELLRDLRSGAFFPSSEALSPFPLTGRARIVNEMIELMHTLDAIERVLQQLKNQNGSGPGRLVQGGAGVLGEHALEMIEGELERLLNLSLPLLPGRAGRNEVFRLLAQLNGPLVDAGGKMLVTKDGLPLRLDQLLWFSTADGLLSGAFKADAFQVHLSPLILYGFDALYSLIGFDGRSLVPPHFAAVQAHINGSELEWVFGQPPLTEGWMRALIERLKDSAIADNNLLGEMLEEALMDGRFHAVLVQGAVSEGEAMPGSFHIKSLLPGPAAENAFAPA
jgi:hypothetical protein